MRALNRERVDPSPLLTARPGTVLWAQMAERIEGVLGHDDTIDRVFPTADPAALTEPGPSPELRIVQMQAPWSDRPARLPLLAWLQVAAGLAARPGRRTVGRSHVERLVVIDPPAGLWPLGGLVASLEHHPRLTVVTPMTRAPAPFEVWFSQSPAMVIQRSLGPDALAGAADMDLGDARRLHASTAGTELIFGHQRGAPADRWCALEAQHRLPEPVPGALVRARAEGRSRFLVERGAVIENRRRIEAHAARANRRSATRELLARVLSRERLVEAWRRSHRNRGAPGVDGVTVDAYAEHWQVNLAALEASVREGRYRPRPYLRLWTPKASGGERAMGIPVVADRVLMGATADVLSTILEPTFSDRSYAYRPGRGARQAVADLVGSPHLSEGWALIADIASYFDNIDHSLLLAMLREHVADDAFVRLVSQWLTNPARDAGQEARPRRGVPQGAPISPVLANLYLTPLDRWMERKGLDYARYADDFVALCENAQQAQAIHDEMEAFLARELRLSVKPTKTAFVAVAEGFDFLGFRFGPDGPTIPQPRLEEARATLDATLALDLPADELLRKVDAYVRGFRAYFDLGNPRTTQALGLLETDRRARLQSWARARRLDEALVADRAERFLVSSIHSPPPGAYEGALDGHADETARVPPEPRPPAPTSLAQVDRRPAAVKSRSKGPQPVAVDAGGHLGIFGFGAAAGLEGERIVLSRKGEVVFEAPLRAFRSVHVDSYGMSLSTPLLEELAARDIPVILSRPGGRAWAVLRPLASKGSADLLSAQLTAHRSPLSITIACALIGAKLANQERLLRYYAKAKVRRTAPEGMRLRESADRISALADDLTTIDSSDVDAARRRVFSVEGRAGASYWSALKDVLGAAFPGRTGRNAVDPINVALNYGYGVLYAATWAAVARAGLDPGVGVLHASTGDRGALVFDLVEPFRVPVVDRVVVGMVSRGKELKLNKDGHLTSATRRKIAQVVGQALQQPAPWGGAARPIGEHLDRHAVALAAWLQGGPPLRALRIRW
jgi:group II intron reverse transcriptase/maturase/CRISPR-associated endonuclease Cas1